MSHVKTDTKILKNNISKCNPETYGEVAFISGTQSWYLLPSKNITIVLAAVYFNYPSLICYLTGFVGQEPRHSLSGPQG